MKGMQQRIENLNWKKIESDLDEWGYALTGPFLTDQECTDLINLYGNEKQFRSVISMERYRFGSGEYKYFADPLPGIIEELRQASYPFLAKIANEWMEKLDAKTEFPPRWDDFYEQCRRLGQTKPTPLILRYTEGGYNCLHQDLYGEVAFPLQLTCVLNRPGHDFTGGEFLLVEQRPRAQSRGQVVVADAGEFILFANRYRPVQGSRGFYRTNMKHGVSRVLSGERYAFGIIFHTSK